MSDVASEKTPQAPEREISAGVIAWRLTQDGPRFLILYHGSNYWNFPKGKIEKEERSFQTAIREMQEETGLSRRDLKFHDGFRVKETFSFRRLIGRSRRRGSKVKKTVIFYMAQTRKKDVHIGKEQGFGWFTYREALKLFPSEKHKDTRRILKQAHDFLGQQKKRREEQQKDRQEKGKRQKNNNR
jgi:8-oxo-dGTP pyrophosphatase MutT (NUDIX family)